jgi:acyl-CoA thioesterase
MTHSEQTSPFLDAIRQNAKNSGFFQLLGLHIDAAQDGKGTVSIHVDAHLLHPWQIVHGGVIFTLADTAMSMALMSTLPSNTPVSTIEAKINYLLPVRSGELVAEANIVRRGRTIAVLEATVYNILGEGREAVALMLGTFNIQQPKTS